MEIVTDNLKLIVMDNFLEFGKKVDQHLKLMNEKPLDGSFSYMVPVDLPRFSNSESKAVLQETVRDKDVYILSDVGNYSCTYRMYGFINHKSTDDHFQDIKRVISACNGSPAQISTIMPLLPYSRQHKKQARESLDCSMGLKELENMHVRRIITFDAHNKDTCDNAVSSYTTFENPYPTYSILSKFIENEDMDYKNLLVISPDGGAFDRARYYANLLGTDVGTFYKRRDLSKVVNGKSPVVEHKYLGADVKGKNIIIVDDMIASGGSILEVAQRLKERGANRIYLITSFALFTDGKDSVNAFQTSYENGYFTKLYTTNLSYVPEYIRSLDWFYQADCSKYMAKFINSLNHHNSITPLLDREIQHEKILQKIKMANK